MCESVYVCVSLYAFLLIIKDISVCIWIRPHIAVLFPAQFLCPSVLNAPLCFDFLAVYICVSVWVCDRVCNHLYSEEEMREEHRWS